MLGQPRPVLRTSSRISSAPPPYIGASATSAISSLMGRLPSRYSATSGAVKKSATAAPMLRRKPVVDPVAGADTVCEDIGSPERHSRGRDRIAQSGWLFQYHL